MHETVVGRGLYQDRITRLGGGAKREMDALGRAIHDDEFVATQVAPPIQRTAANLAPQRQGTGYGVVADGLRCALPRQAAHDPRQLSSRQEVWTGNGAAQRHQTWIDEIANDRRGGMKVGPRHRGGLARHRRFGQGVGKTWLHEKTRLWPRLDHPPVFEDHIRLQYGRNADVLLPAQTAN